MKKLKLKLVAKKFQYVQPVEFRGDRYLFSDVL